MSTTDNETKINNTPCEARNQATDGLSSWRAYTSSYRSTNPEKVRKWRLNAAVSLLKKNGYVIIPPESEDQDHSSEAVTGNV